VIGPPWVVPASSLAPPESIGGVVPESASIAASWGPPLASTGRLPALVPHATMTVTSAEISIGREYLMAPHAP